MPFVLPLIYRLVVFNSLLISLLIFDCTLLNAQTVKPKITDEQAVTNLTSQFREKYQSNRNYALHVAAEKKWPLIKNYANGKIHTLEGIDSLGSPIYYTTHNILAANGTRTSELYTGGSLGLNLSGGIPEMEGKLGIWDGGLARLSHVEFGGRLIQQDNTNTLSDHTTHLSGTMTASGVNPQIRGMAYKAKLSIWNYTDDLAEMAQAARTMLVSNHAYGPVTGWFNNPDRPGNDPNTKWEWWGTPSINPTEDYRFGFYDDKARDLDKLAFNSPYYLIVKSADNKRTENGPPNGVAYFLKNSNQTSTVIRSKNNGYDVIPTDANAKNILTIGAADGSFSSSKMLGFKVADFSGWGPTDDGRIKPDLLGIGTNIISSIASSNNAYATYSGTSMATANVSGSLFLLQELYFSQNKSFMRAATLKALALHTADKPDGKTAPNYEYGWGLLNMEKAAKVLLNTDLSHLVFEKTLRSGEVVSQKIISAGSALLVTISWSDPEGTTSTASSKLINDRKPKLVNDLDIRIVDGDNKDVTWYPWILDPENPSKPATTGDNIRDNVEQIYIPQPIKDKVYTLTIRHKNTLLNSGQPYSLVISGVAPQNCSDAVKLIAGNDTTLCGGKMSLKVSGGEAFKYEWTKDGNVISGSDNSSLDVSKQGVYQVTATGYQCSAQSRTILVQNATLNAAVAPSGTVVACTSNPVPLTSNTGTGYKYQWYKDGVLLKDETSPVYYAREAGKFNVAISDKNCTAVSQNTQLISSAQKPVISTNSGTVIPQNGSIYLTTISGENTAYKWFLDGVVIPTATAARLLASKEGSYVVELTQNDCTLQSKALTLTSATVSSGASVIPSLIDKKNLKLYPNPSTTTLTVSYESDDSYNLEAFIVDERGIPFGHRPLNDNGKVFLTTFDISNLPSGHYLMVISDGIKRTSKPFMKY